MVFGSPALSATVHGVARGRSEGNQANAHEAHADVAQLVEHHLAKVRVASSSLVIRSVGRLVGYRVPRLIEPTPTVVWPRGEATACKAVYTGSNPVTTSHNGKAVQHGSRTT